METPHKIERAEKKHAVLQMAKAYSTAEIAQATGMSESEIRGLVTEALQEIQDRTEDLGRAYVFMELERIDQVKRQMMSYITMFDKAIKESGGIIDQDAEKAFNVIARSSDTMLKYIERTSKMLGLDAPTKLQAITSFDTPDKIMQEAFSELESGELPVPGDEDDLDFLPS